GTATPPEEVPLLCAHAQCDGGAADGLADARRGIQGRVSAVRPRPPAGACAQRAGSPIGERTTSSSLDPADPPSELTPAWPGRSLGPARSSLRRARGRLDKRSPPGRG